jgi:DNA-directed RNA polymerase subunit L
MTIINNYSVEDNIVKFQLNNSKGLYKISFTNALRRILISYIDCYVIDFKDTTFIENNSLFNSEFLKSRLCLIPILSNKTNVNYEFLQVICNKKNEKQNIEDVYVSDFKIKDRTTDKELDIKDFFVHQDILFTKLQIEQFIHFEANLKKSNAFIGGSPHSPVSSCVVTFNNLNYDKEEVIERERNYDLNSKNEPNIYDFYYENIGFFDSTELIKIACDVMVNKLNDLKTKFDNYEYKNDFYHFTLYEENDTLGNLFSTYLLENKQINYSGYSLEHPLKNNIILKIKIEGKKEELFKIINNTIDDLIKMTTDLKKEFK